MQTHKSGLMSLFQLTRLLCDALRNLVPFLQFKKNVKYTHRGVILYEMYHFSMGVFHIF